MTQPGLDTLPTRLGTVAKDGVESLKRRVAIWTETWTPRAKFTDLDTVSIDRPVFLLGLQGGGLTLLSRMLHRNRDAVYCTGNYNRWAGRDELHNVYHDQLPDSLKGPWRFEYRNLPNCNDVFATDDVLNDFRARPDEVTEVDREDFRTILRKIILKYGRHTDTPRFVDKSQTFILKVGYLNRLLEGCNPQFLLFLRNPYIMCKRAVMKSNVGSLDATYETKLDIACEHYRNCVDTARRDAENVDSFSIHRFEDLVKRPERTLKDICSEIEFDYEPDMLPSADDSFNWGGVSRSKWYPIRNPNPKYTNHITALDKSIIENHCGDIIEEFKYDI